MPVFTGGKEDRKYAGNILITCSKMLKLNGRGEGQLVTVVN